MSIIDNILHRLGYAKKQELKEVADHFLQMAEYQAWEMPDPMVFANQADLYRLSPILHMAVAFLAKDIATSRFNVMRSRGEKLLDIPNHELERLLRVPNPLQTGLEFTQETVSSYLLNGNSIWWLNRQGWKDRPTELWNIPFSKIQPVPDGNMYLSHYEYYPGGTASPIPIPTWQIVHFKEYNPNNAFIGLSPVESLWVTIKGDLGMRKTNTRTFTEYGGSPQSILSFKEWINDEAWDKIKRGVQDSARKNEMMMLRGAGEGVTWLSRAMSNKDSEFIGVLKQNMTDVFNVLCPGLLNMVSEGATYSNADAAAGVYQSATKWPMMEALAQKITADVLPSYGLNLIGQYDDPRVKNTEEELKKQEAFERSHTLAEVREQFYQDAPLGDERDKLLVNEIRVKQNQAVVQEQPPQEMPPVIPDEEDEEEPDEATKAALDDLAKLRKMALNGKAAKVAAFKSDYIPALMLQDIRLKLGITSDKGTIAQIFDAKMISLKPKPKVDPTVILRGIEAGVKALELKG